MIDPVARVARRQNTTDRIAELLGDWGCPPEYVPGRVALILDTLEGLGWAMRVDDAPPLRGPGSTDEGRARARQLFADARGGAR